MNIRKTIYGLAALGCMYGAISTYSTAYSLSKVIEEVDNTPQVQRVKSLLPDLKWGNKGSPLERRDFRGLVKICSELDSLKQEGAFEQIQKAEGVKGRMIGYAGASLFLTVASLTLAGLSLGYLRKERGYWNIRRRRKEN